MKRLLSMIDFLSTWVGKLFSAATLIVVFIVVYEVVARYWFKRPTLWANESSLFGCGLVYVMGGAWTLLEKRHINIELIYGKLDRKRKALIDALTFPMFALYVGMLFWSSVLYALDSIQLRETSGTALNPPVYPFKIALSFGIFLLLIQGVAKLARDLKAFMERSDE
jgi:TRAP-type mannitol/chloroaromatic compound transport system permease small subunit